MKRNQEKILGYGVDLFSFKDALAYIEEKMESSQSAQVVTINPEMVELAEKNSYFSQVLKNAELVIPDGVGIKIALKINGINQEQIPGIEFSKELIAICEKKSYSVALIGAKDEILTKACENLKKDYPNLNICYHHDGFFNEQEEAEIIQNIFSAQPKLVLVALGAPKQEIFIDKLKKELKSSIFVGVGGSFDVWSGEVQRAPVVYRKIGCEWLYRLLKQPSRFKRIFPTLPLFLIKVVMVRFKELIFGKARV